MISPNIILWSIASLCKIYIKLKASPYGYKSNYLQGYAEHNLISAKHPSENDLLLMACVVAFVLRASLYSKKVY
jgi:hypothetical protein